MVIEICSRRRAEEAAEGARELTSVISITSPEDRDVVFPENPAVGPILHLKFSDQTQEYDEEGIPYGSPVPKQEDFAGLRSFVTALTCDRLIVHCWEGVSRSAAVAAAVYEFRGSSDRLVTHQDYRPNPLVYMLACGELGIRPGKYGDHFGIAESGRRCP